MTTNSPAVGTTTQSRPKRRRSSSSKKPALTAAIIGLIGTLGTAAITQLPDLVGKAGTIPSMPITEVQPSERVSVDNAKLSDSRTALALWGTASPYVEQVRVTVSAPNAKEALFDDVTNVTDGKWSLVATSDRQIPEEYEVMAFDKKPTFTSSAVHKTSRITFKLDPPTPTTQPGQDSGCPPQSIGGCFADPNWGPPAIYRSE